MNPSLIITELAAVSSEIAKCRRKMTEARSTVGEVSSSLAGIPTKYGPMITAINNPAYTGDLAKVQKNQLALLTAEFVALAGAVDAAQTALTANVTEY
jgi:hypothetical protein